MPTPKWLVVARNEYRVHTGRIRRIRPYFPYLVIGLLAIYVMFIAPAVVSLSEGAVLEVKGANGVLRIDLSEDELRKMLSPKKKKEAE